MSTQDKLSEDEAALYDRQIRLWGLEAQARLMKMKILLIGLSPISGEIIKNIVLSGVNTLVLCDDKLVNRTDIDSCFLFEESHLNTKRNKSVFARAHSLNEKVNITCEDNVSEDFLAENYQDYDEIIISLDLCGETFKNWMKYVQKFCSKPNRPRIHCVASLGMHAVGFADLGHFTFDGDEFTILPDAKAKTESNGNTRLSTVDYPSLGSFFDADWNDKANSQFNVKRMPKGFFLTHLLSSLKEPLSNQSLKEEWPKVALRLGFPISSLSDDDIDSCFGDPIVSVNAIMGGIISQEIIQGLSHKGKPKGNWYFLDGRTCEASILWLPEQVSMH
nr:SUMO activating enzyme subunit 1 [Hymenolepis microstoma]